MLTHEQLMNSCLFISEEGHVFEIDKETEELKLVFMITSVNPDYVNLFRASGVMYQTIQHQLEAIEILLAQVKLHKIDVFIFPFEAMQKSLLLTQRAVCEGIEVVVTELRNGYKKNVQ